MRKVKVKGLGICPQCFNHKLSAFTLSASNDHFLDGEIVFCDNCGIEGVIRVDNESYNWIDWSKRFKPTSSDIVAEISKISDLFTNANLDKYLSEVREAKTRSTNEEHTNFLVKVEAALLLLKEANDKELP